MFARDNLAGATQLVHERGNLSVQTCVAFGTQFWLVPRQASRNTSDQIYGLHVCLLYEQYTRFSRRILSSPTKRRGFSSIALSQKNMADVVSLVTFELSMPYFIYVRSLQNCLLILGMKSYSIIHKNAVPASQEMSPLYKNCIHFIYEKIFLFIVRKIKAHEHILRGIR
jgi:hypothetical protein